MLYNNSGYFLLGAIIEKVSGKSFNDYLHETFFEPLGMHDTGVHSSTAVIKHEATGYSYEGGKLTKAANWDMSRAGAAGSLYSTVEDLMRWNEGVFGGKVLSEESLKAAFTPVKLDSGEEPMMSYGYGWIDRRAPRPKDDFAWRRSERLVGGAHTLCRPKHDCRRAPQCACRRSRDCLRNEVS